MASMQRQVESLLLKTELYKTAGSLDQQLHTSPIVERRQETGTRYFLGDFRGRRCFIKQYVGNPVRAEREYQICQRAGCRQIVQTFFCDGDMVGFEYLEGTKLSSLSSIREPERFLKDLARAVYEITSALKITNLYDFHTNNVIVRDDSTLVFIDFDLKEFPFQRNRIRRFLGESLGKAGASRWDIWRLQHLRPERVGAAMLKKYLRGSGERYGDVEVTGC